MTGLDTLTWPMIFAGGLLGSAHCVGMCGGFALTVGNAATSGQANLLRQLVYSAGRLSTYGLAGGIAAGLGARFSQALPAVEYGQAILALLAGVLLLAEGLKAIGWWPARIRRAMHSCPWRSGFSTLLGSNRQLPVFVAGLVTGWLPCGLVYAFLSLAAQTGSVWRGSATMLAFGSGTVPLMIAFGLTPIVANLTFRRRLFRVAAWCLIATGLLTLTRGICLAESLRHTAPATCPFCEDRERSVSRTPRLERDGFAGVVSSKSCRDSYAEKRLASPTYYVAMCWPLALNTTFRCPPWELVWKKGSSTLALAVMAFGHIDSSHRSLISGFG